jgi:hypothetical protein
MLIETSPTARDAHHPTRYEPRRAMMNLYRIGNTILNVDRINCILDHQTSPDPGAPAGRTVLRVLFEDAHVDLTDKEAQVFRNWFRHASRNLDPHKDEYGEDLVSPDEQMRRACQILRDLIDRDHPRDRVMRHVVHRLGHTIDQFLTGELQPVRAKDFERDVMAH